MFSGGYDLKLPASSGVDVCAQPDISNIPPTPSDFSDQDICAVAVDYAKDFCGKASTPADQCAENALDGPLAGSSELPLRQHLLDMMGAPAFPKSIELLRRIIAGAPPAVCGDSTVTPPEQCDDGNTTSNDGCSASCTIELQDCGDGIIQAFGSDPEQCDDGNTTDGDGCSSTCQNETTPPECGDGTKDPGEQCDDGDTNSGDGCSSTCQNEAPPPPSGPTSMPTGHGMVIGLAFASGWMESQGLLASGSSIDDFGVDSSSSTSHIGGGLRFNVGWNGEMLSGPFGHIYLRVGAFAEDLITDRIYNAGGNPESGYSHLFTAGIEGSAAYAYALGPVFAELQLGVQLGVAQWSKGNIVTERSGPREISRFMPGPGLKPCLALGGTVGNGVTLGGQACYVYTSPLFMEKVPPVNDQVDGGYDLFGIVHSFYVGPYVAF